MIFRPVILQDSILCHIDHSALCYVDTDYMLLYALYQVYSLVSTAMSDKLRLLLFGSCPRQCQILVARNLPLCAHA